MNNRLQQFLTFENLTPARFADMMGLQRSGISHLLSGRNKPGYEFIKKFLTTFPHVNAEWFLLGVGKTYKHPRTESDETETTPLLPGVTTNESRESHSAMTEGLPEASLFAFREMTGSGSNEISNDFPEQSPSEMVISQGNQDITSQAEGQFSKKTAPERIVKQIPPKKIGRITVFYTDGSFDEFFPR